MPQSTELLLTAAEGAIRDVLETMFFSTAVAVPCKHGDVAELISSRVRFEGAGGGELKLVLSRDLARSMAAGFLGEDVTSVPIEAEAQVSCELGNMICGAMLSRLHPDAAVALEAPAITRADFGGAGVHRCFETPEGRLSITLRF